jgi:short-subunit dehydrogenase
MSHNSVAVITGASSGIGAATARLLASNAMTVVLAARRKERLDAIAEAVDRSGGKALAIPCDVTQRNQAEDLIHRTVREFGHIDILINNAGRGHLSSVEDTTDDMIRSMFELNVFALWYATRPALGYMKKQGNGHILTIASIAGKVGFPFNSAYVAAKHAAAGFTYALRTELLGTNIHASVVYPGSVKTDWAEVTEGRPMKPLFSESGPIIKRIAAERGLPLPKVEGVISPERVAEAILACIHKPAADVYTHAGSREYALLAASNREEAEQLQLPIVLGEREVYEEKMRGQGPEARGRK